MFKRPLADPSHDLFEMLRQHPNANALYILYLCLRGPRESLEKTEFPTMSEAQEAAILFIEQWRAHGQALAERDTPYETQTIQSWNLPKPTHLCQALEHVQQQSGGNACYANKTCFVRNGRTLYSEETRENGEPEGADVLGTFREHVYHWMSGLLEHLIDTYGQTVAAENFRKFRDELI